MSTAYKCDRCKGLFAGEAKTTVSTGDFSGIQYSLRKDAELCDGCAKAVMRAIRGAEVAKGDYVHEG